MCVEEGCYCAFFYYNICMCAAVVFVVVSLFFFCCVIVCYSPLSCFLLFFCFVVVGHPPVVLCPRSPLIVFEFRKFQSQLSVETLSQPQERGYIYI
jgi:hypothetical protein